MVHSWPADVRELTNLIERVALLWAGYEQARTGQLDKATEAIEESLPTVERCGMRFDEKDLRLRAKQSPVVHYCEVKDHEELVGGKIDVDATVALVSSVSSSESDGSPRIDR
jgi:DNA-binding NtrC family response regulator